MALAPVHRIDHPIVYIYEDDTAWDHDRIKYELGVLEGKLDPDENRAVPEGKREDHPWIRFVTGASRGDLKTVDEYLAHRDGPDGPVRFNFQRISFERWAMVKQYLDSGLVYDAKIFALRCSLLSAVDGMGKACVKLEPPRKGEPLPSKQIEKLRTTFGDGVIEILGGFAIKASQEITDAEKKP